MFSKFFIDRPVFAAVVSIIIVLAGLIGIKSLPVEEYPSLTPPSVSIRASYPGADATTIAETVAAPLEQALNGVDGMIYMQSTSSSSGTLSINVNFAIGTDSQDALVNTNNAISNVTNKLPEEVRRLGVSVYEASASILEVVAITSESPYVKDSDIYNYVNLNVIDELKRVPGVGNVAIFGDKEYSMRVWIKPDILSKHNLTIAEVTAAIREQNAQYSAGRLGERPLPSSTPYVYTIKPQSSLKSVEEFENIIIKSSQNGSVIRLKDVADVELGSQAYIFQGKLNDKIMVPMLIFLQNDANAIATAELVSEKMKELVSNFPDGVGYEVPYDTTEYVQVSINEVIKTFAEAIFLVLVVMYVFLKNIRATIIPLIAIPVAITGTFAGLYVAGFSINLITLFGLILAIGIVVDDAIIVVENVERNLRSDPNISPKEAAIKSMQEVATPVISIVLVLCAVFVPVTFMEGFVGEIQKQFAATLIVAVVISGFVALTLTPALCAIFLKHGEIKGFWLIEKFNDFFDFSTRIFSAGVAKVLRHIIPSLLVVGILFYATYSLYNILPSSLVPAEDKGAIIAIGSLPPASSLDRNIQETTKISSILEKDKNVKFTTALMGYDLISGSLRENAFVMFINLKDWKERLLEQDSSFSIAGKYNKAFFMDKNSQTFFVNPPPIMGLSVTGGFELYAQNKSGKSYAQIEADMHKLVAAANAHPKLAMVRTTLETNFPIYKAELNIEKIKMLGIQIQDIYSTINATIGTTYVNDFNLFGRNYKVNLRATGEYRKSPEDLRNIFVKANNGAMIPLNSIMSLSRSTAPDVVDRFNIFPSAKIMGDPKPGFTSGEAIEAIEEVFNQTLDTNEYSIGWTGSAYQEVTSSGAGQKSIIIGMIFVFLILAAQYERWIMPFAVISAVPFAVFGSLLATWLRGLNMDVYFDVGLLLLVGLSAKNAILIIEFAMEARLKEKLSIFDATIKAAKLRFRPIIMTSLAFMAGISPLVYSSGAGSASRHSLGTGVIGGMALASTIAIFFIPLFFYILEHLSEWIKSKTSKTHKAVDIVEKEIKNA